MANLKTNYKDAVLDASANMKRVYDIVNSSGSVVSANVSLVDKTKYSQEGDTFGASDLNAMNVETNKSVKSTTVKEIVIVSTLPSTGVEGTLYFSYD